jgi:hypothetical protein
VVQRAEPDGVRLKGTKSGRSRRVPIADRVLPLICELAAGRDAEALLFVTSSGHRLYASAFKRTLQWERIGEGRRIHDLRHTAAYLWLARGVDPVTVQAWMGHASISTTNLYLHHLGTSADRAGLDRLNRRGLRRGYATGRRHRIANVRVSVRIALNRLSTSDLRLVELVRLYANQADDAVRLSRLNYDTPSHQRSCP